jgi:hypothetical protein
MKTEAERGDLGVVEVRRSSTAVHGPTTSWDEWEIGEITKVRSGVMREIRTPRGARFVPERQTYLIPHKRLESSALAVAGALYRASGGRPFRYIDEVKALIAMWVVAPATVKPVPWPNGRGWDLGSSGAACEVAARAGDLLSATCPTGDGRRRVLETDVPLSMAHQHIETVVDLARLAILKGTVVEAEAP